MNINIIYASQDGTSEEFSYTLLSEGKQYFNNITVYNISDYKMINWKHGINIFLLSTHYEGNCPDSADEFNDWIKTEEAKNSLNESTFCLFGLGNSNYDNFNQFSKDMFDIFIKYNMKL